MKKILIIISCIVVSLFMFSCKDNSVEAPPPSQITQIEYWFDFQLGTFLVQAQKDSIHFIEAARQFDPKPVRDTIITDTTVYREGYLASILSLIDLQEVWNIDDNSKYPDKKLTIKATVRSSTPTLPDEEKIKVIKFDDKPSEIKSLLEKLYQDGQTFSKTK
ncbi:MAG: hypothetical protein JST20_10785 [Bacteroidetes bacterium]|nr:hypothetical protein [Bacteroidota bacterium]